MIDFIKKSKWVFSGKSSVIFGVVALFTGMIMSVSFAMGQTEIDTASVTPTVTMTPTVSKKLLWPHKKRSQRFHNDVPGSMQEATEAGIEEIKKQEKAGTLKVSESSQSEAELSKPLPPLTNFKITPLDGGALLKWDAVPGASNYHIYISDNGKKYRPQERRLVKETSIVVGNLENDRVYYFAVAPVGEIHEYARVIQTVVPVKSSQRPSDR